MRTLTPRQTHAAAELRHLLAQRIVILDGAMGTMIQQHQLSEADFRGERFKAHPHDLKGNNDLLSLTRPAVIEDIHLQYFEAGADMVETNTFSSTVIAQADYRLEPVVAELNTAAARVAVQAALTAEAKLGRRCFVAGALGPTNRTLSMSPDVNRPDFRAVSWDQVVAAYLEQARALVAGGAFYNSIRHARPFSIGINCALGGAQMRPYVEELAGLAECYVSCYPNAGLPNAFGGYDESPAAMAKVLGDFAANGWLNIVGGCCGSTPAHIAAIAQAVVQARPHVPPTAPERKLRLSGLEPLAIA